MFKKLRKLDYWIAVPFAILSMLGIVMVFSATQGTTAALSNFIKQAIFVVIGLIGAFFLYHFNLRKLQNAKWMRNIQLGVIAALIIARFVMPPVNGAHGWINLGLITLQPAEFLKLAMILYFANFFARQPWQNHVPLKLQPVSQLNVWGLPLAGLVLVILMPDNGNGLIIILILMALFLASGVSRRVIAVVAALMGLGFGFLQTLIRFANHFLT